MDIANVFGGDTLKASDLQGREVTVTISSVKIKQFDKGNKLLVTFYDKKKGLVANKTNSNRLAKICGSTDTDDWIGKDIVLYVDLVDFQGQSVEAIRVRAPARQAEAVAPNPKSPKITTMQPSGGGGLPDDEIPFATEWR